MNAQVLVDSSLIVFREGLEAVLIFAAVTASMQGANTVHKRPVAAGAGVAFVACVGVWFLFQAVLGAFSEKYGPELQAITGLIAVLVLLVILNWFLHRVYWTGWISHHHKRRRTLLAMPRGGFLSAQVVGLVALGFTSVFREGFEVVLFLQNLQLKAGTPTVMAGTAIGLALTGLVGLATFKLQRRLPYRKMLVVTGALIAFVLVVMIGGTARSFVDLGWLPGTQSDLGVSFPNWLARWLEVVPSVATLSVQAGAAVAVLGSYLVAEHLKVRRPRKRGEQAASRPEQPPVLAEQLA
ncbi:MAG TPA: FTR1 family protein [Thermoleophilaceae bacterium]